MALDLEAARRRLDAEREKLQRLIAAREAEVRDVEADDDEALDEHERSDIGRDIVEAEQQQALLSSLQENLEEVEAALARVDDGSYGIDEVTGEPIDEARLEAFPTARTNVS